MSKRYTKVYVYSSKGNFMSSTKNFAKIRILLKTGKAQIYKKDPFSVMLIPSENNI